MDHPAQDIAPIVRSLTMGSPKLQQTTLQTYFLPDASFAHPLCRVPSFPRGTFPFLRWMDSRWLLLCVYRWYRTLSPKIQLSVDSSVFDPRTNILYLSIHQIFSPWFIPFYKLNLHLIVVLHLVRRSAPEPDKKRGGSPSSSSSPTSPRQAQPRLKYYIARQEDFYQTNDMIQYLSPTFAPALLFLLQLISTGFVVIGSVLLRPVFHFLNKASDNGKKFI